MPQAEVTLPGKPSSVPTARRFVESVLEAWGQPASGWTAALLVSELTANSTLHARTPFTVRVALERGAVRLEVADGSPRLPVVRGHSDSGTTGRGLRLVDELAASWGVDQHADGKTVWVSLHAPGEEPDDADRADDENDLDAVLLRLGTRPSGGPVLLAA